MKPFVTVLLFAALLSGCDDGSQLSGDPEGAPPSPPVGDDTAPAIPPAPAAEPALGDLTLEDHPTPAEVEPALPERTFFHFTRPEHVRGIYVNSWSAGSRRRLAALIDLARRTEINTFVIDIKDATGYVSHRTQVPLAHEIGATGDVRIPNLAWTLERLEEAGIYPIARIVIVKDPLLAAARPELAVQDTAGGTWVDNKGIVWLNPFSPEVWEYHVDLAWEVAAMGVGEVQWDYVRFPDAPASVLASASYPGRDGRPKTDAIREFLDYSRGSLSELGVDVTADVFGVTTSARRDVGIGQVWESFIDVVDVALPMVYPSHYWKGSFGIEEPNGHPYEIVRRALEDAPQPFIRAGRIRRDTPLAPGLHTRLAPLRGTRSARPDPGRVRCRHRRVGAVEPEQPLHPGCARTRGRFHRGALGADRERDRPGIEALRTLRHDHRRCGDPGRGARRGGR